MLTGLPFLANKPGVKALGLVPLAFFALLFYWPLAHVISLGLRGGWLGDLASKKSVDLAWFTAWQATLSMLIAVGISFPTAYLLYHRKFWGQGLLRTIVAIPFVLPSIVVAIGFFSLRKSANLDGLVGHSNLIFIIAANVFMNFGIAVRIIGSNWATLDSSLDDAASLDGAGPLRTFWSISLPQLLPAIAAASSLIFLYCATNFGIVLVLGGGQIKTIETEIYFSATQSLDLHRAASLVLIQSLLTIVSLSLTFKLSARNLHFFSHELPANKSALSRKDFSVQILSLPVIGLLIVAPLLGILLHAFRSDNGWTLRNFQHLIGFGARNVLSISVLDAAVNSCRNAVLVLLISLFVGLLICNVAIKFSPRSLSRRIFEALFQIPVGISTVVLGLGYLTTFGGGIFPLRSSWLVTPIAQSILAIPLVVRILLPALLAVGPDLIESAQTDRATPGDIWWLIQIPIVKSAIYLAAGYAVIISIGDFAAANFLSYGDQATLPNVLFQLISRPGAQNYGMAMAASALFVALTASVIFLTERREGSTL